MPSHSCRLFPLAENGKQPLRERVSLAQESTPAEVANSKWTRKGHHFQCLLFALGTEHSQTILLTAVVGDQPFAHAYPLFDRITKLPVKRDDRFVACPHL